MMGEFQSNMRYARSVGADVSKPIRDGNGLLGVISDLRKEIESRQKRHAELRKVYDDTQNYAVGLANAPHEFYKKESPEFKPFDRPDYVLTQIDNMISGILDRHAELVALVEWWDECCKVSDWIIASCFDDPPSRHFVNGSIDDNREESVDLLVYDAANAVSETALREFIGEEGG
jgi:hypothetical protein